MKKDNIKLDSNNIESGIWLPEELRYYVDNEYYMHKCSMLTQALQASMIILNS